MCVHARVGLFRFLYIACAEFMQITRITVTNENVRTLHYVFLPKIPTGVHKKVDPLKCDLAVAY